MKTLRSWRWSMARRIAPYPIMRDPAPGAEIVIIYRKNGWSWSIQPDRFRLKATRKLASLEYDALREYHPSGPFVRFVGTIGKRP